MIRPLRQRHRRMVCTLGLLVPVAFLAGIAARRPLPIAESVPEGFERKASEVGSVVWTKADLWPGQRILTNLRRDAAGPIAVELIFRDLVKPDVLVYWAAGNQTPLEGLPDGARLLGTLSNRSPLPIPDEVRGTTGRFLLYSLADHEVVAASRPFLLQKD